MKYITIKYVGSQSAWVDGKSIEREIHIDNCVKSANKLPGLIFAIAEPRLFYSLTSKVHAIGSR